MDQLTAPLVADHRHCDGLFATAEDAAQRADWAACREQFDSFRAAMLHRFDVEENVLYPMSDQALAASGIDLAQQVTACE